MNPVPCVQLVHGLTAGPLCSAKVGASFEVIVLANSDQVRCRGAEVLALSGRCRDCRLGGSERRFDGSSKCRSGKDSGQEAGLKFELHCALGRVS